MDDLEQLIRGNEPTTRPVNNPGNLRPSGANTGFQQFQSAQEGILDGPSNKSVFDNSKFGEEDFERNRPKPKFDRSRFEGFK